MHVLCKRIVKYAVLTEKYQYAKNGCKTEKQTMASNFRLANVLHLQSAQRDTEFVQSEVMFIFARCKRFAAPAADLLSIDIGSFQMHFVFNSRYTI